MSKKPFTIQMDTDKLRALEKLGEPYGMEKTSYAVAVLSRLSDLKPEFALHAITAIPKEFFKSGPGRPAKVETQALTQ
jgi:hypothetical protein